MTIRWIGTGLVRAFGGFEKGSSLAVLVALMAR
jgi:hypothetical protein